MPTLRPRIALTESEELAEALRLAAIEWPEERGSKAALVSRLALVGAQRLQAAGTERARRRHDRLAALQGSMTGTYPAGYLKDLRADWADD